MCQAAGLKSPVDGCYRNDHLECVAGGGRGQIKVLSLAFTPRD
jgi:hypothetical protein